MFPYAEKRQSMVRGMADSLGGFAKKHVECPLLRLFQGNFKHGGFLKGEVRNFMIF